MLINRINNINVAKLCDLAEGVVSETNTFYDIYNKCKTKLPMNKFMGASNNVRKHLKKLQTLNIHSLLEARLSKAIDPPGLTVLLEDCIIWIKLVVSTSDACLKAFGHCEQNLKIGHFLVYYVSFLAVLARLHTLSKAMYFMIGKLAVEIQSELNKNLPIDQRNIIIEKFKQELLSTMGVSNEYASVLSGSQEHFDVILQENGEDLGEIISRSFTNQTEHEDGTSGIPKLQTEFETQLKGALSVRNLRQIFRRESSNLSETKKAEVEKILLETQHTCKILLDAKRAKIQQAGQLIACLLTNAGEISPESQDSNSKFEEKEELMDPTLKEHHISLSRFEKLLNSMPSADKLKKLCRESLPNIDQPKKRKLMNILQKAKTDLVALKEAGKTKEFKKHMSLLTKKIKKVGSSHKYAPVGQEVQNSLNTSDMCQTLLESSEIESEKADFLKRKQALGKALKSTKTLDGLLETWNDLLCDKRQDITCLLPSNVKRSKLVCVKNNILKLKKCNRKHNLKSAIKKITGFVFT